MPAAVPLKAQLAWVREQRQWRTRWLAEGHLGGHGPEALARYRRELGMLEALAASLALLQVRQLSLSAALPSSPEEERDDA